jgi:flagellar biogenesis protein FliO
LSKRTKPDGDACKRHFMAACKGFSLKPTGLVHTRFVDESARRQENISRFARATMLEVVRRWVWLLAVLGAAAGAERAGAADYPDYVPSPPPAEGEPADRAAAYGGDEYRNRPAELRQPGELRQPAGFDRAAELRRAGDEQPPAAQRDARAPIQQVDYQEAAAAPLSDALPPQKPVDDPHSIPLAPPSDEGRSLLRTGAVPPLVTGAASLGIVLALFLLVVWVVRRGMPSGATVLSQEVVEVLGRAPLVGRQQVHLIRCGHKLLLVCVSPGSVETLTEITDPVEVERLAGICRQMNSQGVSATFRQVFQHFPKPSRDLDYMTRREADDLDFGDLSGAHRGPESRV